MLTLRRTATVAAAALALTLTACATQTTPASQAGEAGESGGVPTLHLAIGGEPDDGFDPTLGWGRYGSPLFQSTLLQRDANLDIQLDLATDYSVSEDGLVWTVTIRDDATFSDGTPVTAQDVAYTFTTAATSGGLTDVTALESAVATDEHTVELRLSEPRSTFINRLVSLGIVPEHAHNSPESQQSYAAAPIGSGPYRLVDWQRGQQMTVERNDDYYGTAPEFERIVFLFSDEDATLAAARAGQLHIAGVPAALATHDIPGMEVVAIESIDNRGISLPTVVEGAAADPDGDAPVGNDVTADPAIREAISYAVDREALVDGILEGFGSPATGPVDGAPWANPDAVIGDADPERAEEVLDAAGWTEGAEGVREKDGVAAAFNLLYPASDSLRQGLAVAVADMAKTVGISVTPVGASWEEIEQRMHSDAVLFGWGSHDPTEMFNLYHSSQAGVGYWNPGFYANPTVDAHLEQAMAATDQDTANAAWQAAQLDSAGEGFTADYPWVWLVNLDHTYFVDECLDLGQTQVEPHGHGWPITAGITAWHWNC